MASQSVQQFLHRSVFALPDIPDDTQTWVSSGMSGRALPPQTCAFLWGDLDPHLVHGSLSQSEPTNKMASRLVQLFCTTYGRLSSGMPRHVLSPKNCPFAWGIWTHLIHASLGSSESTTCTASRSVQLLCTAHCRAILYNGSPSPPQNYLFPWRSRPHLIHGSLDSRVINLNDSNGISIGSAVFAGLTSVTDRPTDHTTQLIRVGCIYVRSTVMRPNNNKWSK